MLVHGLVISSRYMVPLARALASDFPVYAPDLPGFGESDKPRRVLGVPELAEALHAWMRALGLPRAALVANSFGCQIAAELAARHPGAVDRLVLQGPTVDADARSLPVQVWRTLRNGRTEPAALGRISAVDYAKAGLGRAVRTTRAMMRDRIEDKLPRIKAPTLVVRGSRDPVVPRAWAERVARSLPDGRLVVVEGGTHTLNYADPDRLAAVIRTFLLRAGGVPRRDDEAAPGHRPLQLRGRAGPGAGVLPAPRAVRQPERLAAARPADPASNRLPERVAGLRLRAGRPGRGRAAAARGRHPGGGHRRVGRRPVPAPALPRRLRRLLERRRRPPRGGARLPLAAADLPARPSASSASTRTTRGARSPPACPRARR